MDKLKDILFDILTVLYFILLMIFFPILIIVHFVISLIKKRKDKRIKREEENEN